MRPSLQQRSSRRPRESTASSHLSVRASRAHAVGIFGAASRPSIRLQLDPVMPPSIARRGHTSAASTASLLTPLPSPSPMLMPPSCATSAPTALLAPPRVNKETEEAATSSSSSFDLGRARPETSPTPSSVTSATEAFSPLTFSCADFLTKQLCRGGDAEVKPQAANLLCSRPAAQKSSLAPGGSEEIIDEEFPACKIPFAPIRRVPPSPPPEDSEQQLQTILRFLSEGAEEFAENDDVELDAVHALAEEETRRSAAQQFVSTDVSEESQFDARFGAAAHADAQAAVSEVQTVLEEEVLESLLADPVIEYDIIQLLSSGWEGIE